MISAAKNSILKSQLAYVIKKHDPSGKQRLKMTDDPEKNGIAVADDGTEVTAKKPDHKPTNRQTHHKTTGKEVHSQQHRTTKRHTKKHTTKHSVKHTTKHHTTAKHHNSVVENFFESESQHADRKD